MKLPYDMGNAGDLLKHGVLAEFVRWQCDLGLPLRFLDPFGGEPWGRPVPEVARRVRALKPSTLHAAQSDIHQGRYYGSGLLVHRAAQAAGGRSVSVLSGDRRERLRARGLSMLDEALSEAGTTLGHSRHDGYGAFEKMEPMTRAFDKIMAGLEDARTYLNGDPAGFVVHEIEVPRPDVAAIRGKTGLSQSAFARSIGISLGTLKNWEQGRRRPEGPARVLLALMDKRPSIVQDELQA